MQNSIEYKVYGKYALFTDPVTKIGGEKCSYQVPTYQALKGITESIYWKPTIQWIIDECRVMRPIRMEAKNFNTIKYYGGSSAPSVNTYLKDVEYRVKAHFVFNENRPELADDYNENKHFQIAKRMLEKGGRRDIFLGTRECQGYVEPCGFMDGSGAYDGMDLSFGMMVHGITYPDEAIEESEKGCLTVRLWNEMMQNGIIKFPHPKDCRIKRPLHDQNMKAFGYECGNFSGLREFDEGVF